MPLRKYIEKIGRVAEWSSEWRVSELPRLRGVLVLGDAIPVAEHWERPCSDIDISSVLEHAGSLDLNSGPRRQAELQRVRSSFFSPLQCAQYESW